MTSKQLLERCRDKLAAIPFGDDKPATVKQLLSDLDAAIAQQAEPAAWLARFSGATTSDRAIGDAGECADAIDALLQTRGKESA